MNILVIGSGGREHALVWKLRQSKKVRKIFCAPGNAGMGRIAKCINIKVEHTRRLAEFAASNKINLTIVGPEQPLALGIVDDFQKKKLKIFGPGKRAARLESSKVFAKELMKRYHIPTAPFKVFDNLPEAIGFSKTVVYPVVIKVDGLAAGKGVMIAKNFDEASAIIENIFSNQLFGQAGSKIVIETFLKGQEISVMAITDGATIIPLLASQDHKQAFEGDRGPNTGGMGAYCPTDFATPDILQQVHQFVLEPTIKALRNEGITYKGVLYAGLMLTDQGLKVLEFNCRFGDPETQVVLPMMKSDLLELLKAAAEGRLANLKKPEWRNGAAACVIMASKGYPGKYDTGININGLQNSRAEGCYVFHAGTKRNKNQWITAGGRVLGVMGQDENLKSALKKVYGIINRIKFEGAHFRKDIGFRVLPK